MRTNAWHSRGHTILLVTKWLDKQVFKLDYAQPEFKVYPIYHVDYEKRYSQSKSSHNTLRYFNINVLGRNLYVIPY